MSKIAFLLIFMFFLIHWSTKAQEATEYYNDDPFNYKSIAEFIELYDNKLHEVIYAKMKANHYKISNSIPEYKLGEKEYFGEYEFEKSIAGSVMPEWTIENSWKFKSISYSNIASEHKIEFDLLSSSSFNTFHSLIDYFLNSKKFKLIKLNCFNEDTCIRIGFQKKVFCETKLDYSPEFELSPFLIKSWNSKRIYPANDGVEEKVYPFGENEEYYVLDLYLGKEYKERRRTLRGSLYILELHKKIIDTNKFMIDYNLNK